MAYVNSRHRSASLLQNAEICVDSYHYLDRSDLDAVQIVCRLYRDLIRDCFADKCLRIIESADDYDRPRGNAFAGRIICEGSVVKSNAGDGEALKWLLSRLRNSVVGKLTLTHRSVDTLVEDETIEELFNTYGATIQIRTLFVDIECRESRRVVDSALSTLSRVHHLQISWNDAVNNDDFLRFCATSQLSQLSITRPMHYGYTKQSEISEQAIHDFCFGKGGDKPRTLLLWFEINAGWDRQFLERLVGRCSRNASDYEVTLVIYDAHALGIEQQELTSDDWTARKLVIESLKSDLKASSSAQAEAHATTYRYLRRRDGEWTTHVAYNEDASYMPRFERVPRIIFHRTKRSVDAPPLLTYFGVGSDNCRMSVAFAES